MNLRYGIPYSNYVIATDGISPYTYTLRSGVLPPGIYLNSYTGQLFGTPVSGGAYTVGIEATDNKGNTGGICAYFLVSCSGSFLTANFPEGIVGQLYSSSISMIGGTQPITYSLIGSLPDGLNLYQNGIVGSLYGTIASPSSSSFSILATDSLGCQIEDTFTIGVCGNLIITMV